MKITLRDSPKHPFFYTVDRVIGVTRTKPEQVIDRSKLTQFHLDIIEMARKQGIIDVVDEKATPAADPTSNAIPYSINDLRKMIGRDELTVEKAKELIQIEMASKEPRRSIIKELNYFIKRSE